MEQELLEHLQQGAMILLALAVLLIFSRIENNRGK